MNVSVKQNRKKKSWIFFFKSLNAFHVLLIFKGVYQNMWDSGSCSHQTWLPECTEEHAQKQSWLLEAILQRKNAKTHFGYPLFILKSASCTCQYVTFEETPGTGTGDHCLTAHVRDGVAEIAAFVPSSLRHCTAVQILNMISNSILELSWTACL